MDLSADSATVPNHTTVEGLLLEQGQSLASTHCETQSGGTILLQLLEFKTHLLEVVEELHIRRDAEIRFEDQLSKLVLDKQEQEWEKESLQQQIETGTKQHKQSLDNIKKQFQAKIRNIEEEKGKYQVGAELKDKEITNLKEELKSLQLLKYNLEKKSSELQQKLALQNRSKESQLSQLGEVEKRFTALSRQCAVVKQSHEKLEQNVDEAMRVNKKLSSANTKQEETIVSLRQELEDVTKKLIKAKVTSVRHDETHSPTGKEQHVQQLHRRLNMETEMNKRLSEENKALRAGKKEVLTSLQHAQQLLLSQTQTVSRVELELQTQREQYRALKQEHEVMREKSKKVEDELAQLMESYAACKTSWDKKEMEFLDRVKSEQQQLQAVKEAHDELHQKQAELLSQAKVQGQQICEAERRDSSQSISVSIKVFPTLEEEVRAEDRLSEPTFSSEQPLFVSLQLASTQAQNPDCLQGSGAVKKLVTRTTGGSDEPDVVSDLIYSTSCVSDDNLLISKTVGLAGKDEHEVRDTTEKNHGGEDDLKKENSSKLEEINKEQQSKREDVLHVKDSGSNGLKRRLVTETTDQAGRREENKSSAEDAGDTRNHERETRDRAEREGTDGLEERGKIVVHTSETPETQIQAQTTADTTIERSSTRQVIDFTDTESPLTVSDPSDFAQRLSEKVFEKDAHSRLETGKEVEQLNLDDGQSIIQGLNPVIQEVENAEDNELLNQPFQKSKDDFLTKLSTLLNDSVMSSSQTSTVLIATPREGTVSIQELETNTEPTSPNILPAIALNGKKMDETHNTHGNEECSQSLAPNWEASEQKTGQAMSLVTDDRDGHPSARKKCEDLSDHVRSACLDLTTDTVDPESEVEPGSCQKLDEADESFLPSTKTHKPSFDWSSAQRKTASSRSQSDVLILPQFVEGAAQNTSWSGRNRGHPPSTKPMFLKSKTFPSVISRASDLLNASSVSGTPASFRTQQHKEWESMGETFRETTGADMVSRASVSISSFPGSTSSSKVSRLWQAASGCNRAHPSAAGHIPESDWEPSCSQESEDQQPSFRAQISIIEQFLNAERLRLRKRPDN